MFFNKKIKKMDSDSSTPTENSVSNNLDKKNKKKRKIKKRYILIFIFLLTLTALSVVRFTILTNQKVENIITSILKDSLGRDVEIASFKYSILFTHVEIEDIIIYNSDKFDNKENVLLDRIHIRLSIPSLFLLKIKIKDISFDGINIYIFTDKFGNWNIPDLKQTEPPPPPDPDKKPFDLSSIDFLKFLIDIDNISIKNLNIFANSIEHDKDNGFDAILKNFNFEFAFTTKRFPISKMLGVSAVDFIDELKLKMLMNEADNINFKNAMANFKSNFLFALDINYPQDEKLAFDLDIDTGSSEANINNAKINNIQTSFHLHNTIDKDSISINLEELSFYLFNEKALGVSGYLNNVNSTNATDIFINNASGNIDLGKLNTLINIFLPSLGINTSGNIIIDDITLEGGNKSLNSYVTLLLDNVDFKMGETISLNNLNISNHVDFNYKSKNLMDNHVKLKTLLTMDNLDIGGLPSAINTVLDIDIDAPLSGITSISQALADENIKPNINININELTTKFNEADINGNGYIKINEPFELSLNVVGFALKDFTDDFLRGRANLDVLLSGMIMSAVDIDINGIINNFSYNMQGDVSRMAKANLTLDARANLITEEVKLNALNISLNDFLDIKAKADLKGLGLKGGVFDIEEMRIAPYSIKNWLSPNFASILNSIPFEDDIYINNILYYGLDLDNQKASITNRAEINILDDKYPLNDLVLKLNSDVNFSKDISANIREFELSSETNNFHVKANGFATPNINDMNVFYDIVFDNEKIMLPASISVGGLLSLTGNLKDSIASGKFKSEDFFFRLGDTEESEMLLEDLNGDFDYHFDIIANRYGKDDNLTMSRYTPLTHQEPNISFKQFKLNLNIPGIINDAIRVLDFSAVFDINSHAIAMKDGNASLYIGGERSDIDFFDSVEKGTSPKRGAISIPWFIFDIGDFTTTTFKYDMRILASDINLKYLLPPEGRENIDEEKVLVNFTGDIAGVGIMPLRSINISTFFLGINKMSLEFSKFLVEMIKPLNPSIEAVENIIRFGYDPNVIEFSIANNKLFTTFYFRDQNLDKKRQQKAQLVGFKDDRLRLEPILFSDVISYIESIMN